MASVGSVSPCPFQVLLSATVCGACKADSEWHLDLYRGSTLPCCGLLQGGKGRHRIAIAQCAGMYTDFGMGTQNGIMCQCASQAARRQASCCIAAATHSMHKVFLLVFVHSFKTSRVSRLVRDHCAYHTTPHSDDQPYVTIVGRGVLILIRGQSWLTC